MQEADFVLKEIKINEATVTLRKDGVVSVFLHKGITLDVPLQMLLLNLYNEITEGLKHPFLFEAMSNVKVTKEARENAIRIEPLAPGSAYAVVAQSKAYALVANFYLTIRKPQSPYKVFTDREKALKWLYSFL